MTLARFAFALPLIAALYAGAANAQTNNEPQNLSAERFLMTLDRDGIVVVEWGDVPGHLAWDLGLWFGSADDPMVLYREGGDERRGGDLVGTRVGAGIVGAIGLFDWVQLGLEVPLVVYQTRSGTGDGIVGQLSGLDAFGVGNLRVTPKFRILRQRDFGVGLALLTTVTLPTAQQDHYFGERNFTFAPEAVLSRRFRFVRVAMNGGVRLRESKQFALLAQRDELFGRVGAGVRFADLDGPPVGLDFALAVATAAQQPFGTRYEDYVEALADATYDFDGPLLAFLGGGVGLDRGYGTPDWRVFAGIRLSDHEEDRDRDGIADDVDVCPDDAEDRDDFEDGDGCPDYDNDRDGVDDVDDGAPLDPEDRDAFEDGDGVPDPDNDKDGVLDVDDRCPTVAGPADQEGCPTRDEDGDGLVGADDACTGEAEDFDGFDDADGCPDPDNDGDGVLDAADRCPDEAGPSAHRGCPDPDRDRDGVVDRLDNCPDEAGTAEQGGCATKQLVRIEADRIVILDRVYFKTSSARIRPRSFELLDNVATVLANHAEIERVEVQGHTDDRGSDANNLALSERRAESVRTYLVRRGIDAARLVARGYGETAPISSNDTADGRAENRRVEFKILD